MTAVPTATTTAAAAGSPQLAANDPRSLPAPCTAAAGARRSVCSRHSASVSSVSAPAWCAVPSAGGTYVSSVAMPSVTCAHRPELRALVSMNSGEGRLLWSM